MYSSKLLLFLRVMIWLRQEKNRLTDGHPGGHNLGKGTMPVFAGVLGGKPGGQQPASHNGKQTLQFRK